MTFLQHNRTLVALALFTVVFIGLTVSSYPTKSATWDEPYHLTAGYAAARLGDYRMDIEHPPLLRMWAALPLLWRSDVTLQTNRPSWRWASFNQLAFGREFLYQDNDADRLLNRARFMIVLLGVALGGLLFCWAKEWFGFWPAIGALTLYTLEPNLLAHAGLVTTDFGVTFLIFGTAYFVWRVAQRLTWGNLTGLIIFCALTHVSKFSAVLLWPIIGALLFIRALQHEPWPVALGRELMVATISRRFVVMGSVLLLLAVTCYAGIWGAYRFRQSPTPSEPHRYEWHSQDYVRERIPGLVKLVERVDALGLLPNAYLEGFLLGQANAHERTAYLGGHYSVTGWWYYFPVAFLLKTPMALLLLFFAGLGIVLARWRTQGRKLVYVLVPAVVYLGFAMTARLNIGLRHVLPIYPFVILLATAAVAQLLAARRRVWLGGVGLAALVELALVYPHYLTFFNRLAGGPRAGHEWLVDSNLDWGQDLKALGTWMKQNRVPRINLCYFGSADPAYYGITCRYLPGHQFARREEIWAPELPGYVAVSATHLRGAYFTEKGRGLYAPLLEREPVAVLGNSIYVYRVEEPW